MGPDLLLNKWREADPSTRRVILVIILLLVVLAFVLIGYVASSAGRSGPVYGAPWQNPRLRSDVRPKHYNITMYIDVTLEKFWGTEIIEVNIQAENVSTIIIHANNITIRTNSDDVKMFYKKGDEDKKYDIKIKRHRPMSNHHYHIIYLSDYLKPDKANKYYLQVSWTGILYYTKLQGLYFSKYTETEGGQEKKLVSSQFQPISAREAFPCFDEPEFKATFDMVIVAEQNYSFVSWNTKQVGAAQEFEENGRKWKKVKFDTSPTMSTYLLAFVVANYECAEKTTTSSLDATKQILLRVCGRPQLIAEKYADYALDAGETILKYYEEYFQQAYPLTKCDHVGVPDLEFSGMENWGLILYGEEFIMFNANRDGTKAKGEINRAVAHELAHMWFGNLVTMRWWNDIWLNEGFATYVGSLGTKNSESEWHSDEFLIQEWRVPAMAQDSYTSSRSASVIVTDPGNLDYLFDSIAYFKGASMLRQLNMVMSKTDGDNTINEGFQDGVKLFLAAYKESNADSTELYEILDKSYKSGSDVTVKQIMKTWTIQMNFPVVTVEKYDDDNLIFSQRRFLIADETQGEGSEPSPYGYQWYVPIKYKTHKNHTDELDVSELLWLRPNGHVVVPFSQDSIFVNWDGNGFYATSYSFDLWNKLINDLTVLELGSREIQVLLYDTYLLVNAGYYPLSRELQLLNIWSESKNYNILSEVFRQIDEISGLIKDDEMLLGKWKEKWAVKTVTQYIATKGKDATYLNLLMKSLTMSLCLKYNDNKDTGKACVQDAADMWTKMKGDPGDDIPPDYKSAVYGYAASQSEENWSTVWDLYTTSNSTAEKKVLSTALAQTNDAVIIKKYIGYCMNDNLIRRSHGLSIMRKYIAPANSVSAKVSLDYMLDKWPEIYENFKSLEMDCPKYVHSVISQITTAEDLKKVKDIFEDEKSGYMNDVIKVYYNNALDTASANIAWLDKHRDAILP